MEIQNQGQYCKTNQRPKLVWLNTRDRHNSIYPQSIVSIYILEQKWSKIFFNNCRGQYTQKKSQSYISCQQKNQENVGNQENIDKLKKMLQESDENQQ